MNSKCVVMFLLTLSLTVSPLPGQMDRGTINGTVKDASGGVLSGVEIKATNQNTGLQTTTLSNDVGDYRLLRMTVGTYRIAFSLPGFKTFERTDFNVSVGQVHRLDVRLEIGEVSDSVIVSANSEMLSENALVSTTLQNEVITDLPISFSGGRIAENFAFAVTPGVEGDNWESFMGGGQAFSKEVLIDGISASAQIQGNFLETPASMEAIQEFKVQTSGMSAEYGRTSGGVFSYALKSGTNDFHGSLLHYGRNEALNANTWMNNWNLADDPHNPRYKRARDREVLWGGSAGGPIYIPGLYKGRDRSFFFFAVEHDKREDYELGTLDRTVPLPAFLDGDFSALLDTTKTVGTDALGRPVYSGQIYNPATLRQEGGKWVSDPFPGNIIPKSQISPASARIADLFRKQYPPSVNRLTNNNAGTATNSPWFRLTQYTMKGDHQLS
ncbi:MAG: carboxypeptidase regulatory-like domain-containing protein, partial [Acidobacteria bacterium]